ncbi:unnamed protein product [Peniophora sp. CBMAI 1063]|nr:unnamed protein product [Peniophora sp. CBMAI 1063]
MPAIRNERRKPHGRENFGTGIGGGAAPPRQRRAPSPAPSIDSGVLHQDEDGQLELVKDAQQSYVQNVNMSTGRIKVKCMKSHPAIKGFMGAHTSLDRCYVPWVIANAPENKPRTIVPGSIVVTRADDEEEGFADKFWCISVTAIKEDGTIVGLYWESLKWTKAAIKKGMVHEPDVLLKVINGLPKNTNKEKMLFATNEQAVIPVGNIVAACTEQEFRSLWGMSSTYSFHIRRENGLRVYKVLHAPSKK